MNEHDPQIQRNIKLVLEYDGSGYHGWQRQAGSLSIQEVIESRLGVMLGKRVGIRASGRTDAGVHAKGQVVNFHTRTSLTSEEILRGLNSLLPRRHRRTERRGGGRVFPCAFFSREQGIRVSYTEPSGTFGAPAQLCLARPPASCRGADGGVPEKDSRPQ